VPDSSLGRIRLLLPASIRAGTLDPAGVVADEAVLNGGGEDGFEKPVGLGGSDPTDTGIEEIGPPAGQRCPGGASSAARRLRLLLASKRAPQHSPASTATASVMVHGSCPREDGLDTTRPSRDWAAVGFGGGV
jgi:hypothetical protein